MIDRAKRGKKRLQVGGKQQRIAVFEKKNEKREPFVQFFFPFELLRRAAAVKVKLSVTTPSFSFSFSFL